METHSLDDLIMLLTTIRKEHGNLNVTYWDQESVCKMEEKYLYKVIGNNLLFGGFHMNRTHYTGIDEYFYGEMNQQETETFQ